MARPANTALRLGAHMSTAGGFHRAVERALSVDATALQIFVKSARQWKPAPLDPEAAARFRADAAAAGLAPYTLAHASYLINLAAGDAALRRRSVEALAVEMERCERLGVPGLVLHPGSHVGDGEEVGLERIVAALDDLLPAPRGRARRGTSGCCWRTRRGRGATSAIVSRTSGRCCARRAAAAASASASTPATRWPRATTSATRRATARCGRSSTATSVSGGSPRST